MVRGMQGARFAKWRSVISIPAGPSPFALQDCAYGLARYAAIAQVQAHLIATTNSQPSGRTSCTVECACSPAGYLCKL